jgi:hypothetical protein
MEAFSKQTLWLCGLRKWSTTTQVRITFQFILSIVADFQALVVSHVRGPSSPAKTFAQDDGGGKTRIKRNADFTLSPDL